MTDADIARQPQHVTLVKNVSHQAIALPNVQPVFTPGNDARGILTPVLEDRERIVDGLVDRAFANDSYDAAHNNKSFKFICLS
jgi:hypothetical protein